MSVEQTAGIASIGAYVPERVVTNDDMSKIVDTSDEWIFARTGIRERRFARDDEYTSDMAIEASKIALERAEMEPGDVKYTLVATASPDNRFPNTACWVNKGLGIDNTPALDISTACSGFVFGVELAAALVNSGSHENVLVIGAEKLSAITNFKDRSSCILFADGAGAAVIKRTNGRAKVVCSRTGSSFDYDALSLPAGGVRMPLSHEVIDKGGHNIHLAGRSIYKFAVQKFAEMAKEACEHGGISIEEIALVVPHQANINIIQSAMGRVGVPMDKVVNNIDRYGNTSSASVPIALNEAIEGGRLKPGDYVLTLAFGGGLSWGYNLLKW